MPFSIAVMLGVAATMAAQQEPVEPTPVANAFQVRSVPALRAVDRAKLAELAKPSWHTVPNSGSSLRALLLSVCGTQGAIVDKALESEMLRLNGGESLDRIAEPGSAVAVPFCLGVQTVTVKPSDTLEGLLRRHYRTYGKITVRQSVELNASSVEAAKDVVGFTTTLQPGDEIVLPTSVENLLVPAHASTRLTRDQIARGVEKITAILGEAAIPVAADVEGERPKPHEYKYIEFVSTDNASNLPDCGPTTTPRTFAIPKLRARLAVELELAAMIEAAKPAIVGVIDSGLRGLGGEFFARSYFAPNQKERFDLDPPQDRDHNGYYNDVYGINMNGPTGNGSIMPYEADLHLEHGTRVASLVLGGPEWVESAPPDIPSSVRLKIVNFSSSSHPHPVESSLLLDAITYLKKAKVDIVNMSLSSAQPVDGATQGIRDSWPLLFVVAAGNGPSGIDLGIRGAYPAAQGGRIGNLSDRVVTVGAHDNAGHWAPYSNYSGEYVDLLAPGCAIPTSDGQGGIDKEYGTSIATATVSFVAGLVRSLGEDDPQAIKNRLLASVDVDPLLEGRAWTSGRLNAIKAVSVRSDVIETTAAGDNLLFGRLEDKELLRQFCDDETTRKLLENVVKVRPNIPRDGKVWVEYWGKRDDGALWRKSCPQRLANESIGTLVSNGGAVAAPALQNVRDIVLATLDPLVPPAPP
ncbi:MAG: S8 family serine peptidase [Acidobacteriota bacterium]